MDARDFYALKGPDGMEALVTDYGAAIAALYVPDKKGNLRDVVLGYDQVSDYEKNTCFFGAVVGRNANRIGGAEFVLNGRHYALPANQGENNLHSGPVGFDRRHWKLEERTDSWIRLSYHSPDGDQGFPGDLDVSVTYSFGPDHDFEICYEALSPEDTLINLTNHTYFNLNGQGKGDILTHQLVLEAEEFTPIQDAGAIPTGQIRRVEGTAFDFRQRKEIGRDIEAGEDQLLFGQGYDHNFVLRGWRGDSGEAGEGNPPAQGLAKAGEGNPPAQGLAKAGEGNSPAPDLAKAAEVCSRESGISLVVSTDRPGVQFYTGNHIYPHRGKGGACYQKHSGFCLETQSYPDSIHQPNFPSPIQKGGQVWRSKTRWQFRTESF